MTSLLRFFLGSADDWHLRRPSWPNLRPKTRWFGALLVTITTLGSWPAFAGATGEEGNVAFGLWIGAVAIMGMAWSFVLALRPRALEGLFGGLDKMYRVHRWAGTLAVLAMFLHTRAEPEIDGGIRGASKSVAETAEGLAETGELMIYGLVALSLIRIFPYRLWRWTHKLLGIPFAFACWHFFTAEKPYANDSAWGIWFGFWMLAGLAAFVGRVVGRDMVQRGVRYRVAEAEHRLDTTRLVLEPVGAPLGQELGQFAFLKLDAPGMREPHPFTIASSPDRNELEFFIRHLGDWTDRLPEHDLVNRLVTVEGPYGRFDPFGHSTVAPIWIAGGVGITPFLAALDQLAQPATEPPVLFYAVRSTDDNPIVDRLRRAEADGRLELHLFTGSNRLSPEALDRRFPDGLAEFHVAMCGPAGLVASMAEAAHSRGAVEVETEDFDIRQGVGPNRSRELAGMWSKLRQRLARKVTPLTR